MNSEQKFISISVSNSLYQALKTYQEQQQLEEPASAVVEILTQFLQLDEETKPYTEEETKPYATVEQLKALEAKVAYLTKQVAAFGQLVANSTSTTAETSQQARGGTNHHPEEGEDEPDEIIYDFL